MTPTPATPAPAANLSLTDRSTWAAILTIVNAVVLNVFHKDLAPWVPAAAILAAAVVTGLVAHGKHQLAAAVAAAPAAIIAADTSLPPGTPTVVKQPADVAAEVATGALALLRLYAPQSPAAVSTSQPAVQVPPAAPAAAQPV